MRAGLAKAMNCGGCHREDYDGYQHLPRLANIDTSMNGVMYRVTDSDIQALAHYLTHQ